MIIDIVHRSEFVNTLYIYFHPHTFALIRKIYSFPTENKTTHRANAKTAVSYYFQFRAVLISEISFPRQKTDTPVRQPHRVKFMRKYYASFLSNPNAFNHPATVPAFFIRIYYLGRLSPKKITDASYITISICYLREN